jgi:hypothetical protein
MRPREVLSAGARELDGVLSPHGFVFTFTDEGKGSGGIYASGEYRRGNRRLEIHYRWSLGLVRYHVGKNSLAHAEYVRAVRAITATSREPSYPGFSSDDALAAFGHLRHDLEGFGELFLRGSDRQFDELWEWTREHPVSKGLGALP